MKKLCQRVKVIDEKLKPQTDVVIEDLGAHILLPLFSNYLPGKDYSAVL